MSKEKDTSKLWGGRFSEATDAFVQRFTASVAFDQRMAAEDIAGSLAHARMLRSVGVLSPAELGEIESGMAQVQREIAEGSLQWSIELEDVHMNIEARLTELIGVTGKKLHTGRSRIDQVATDIRLHLRSAIDRFAGELTRLQQEIRAGRFANCFVTRCKGLINQHATGRQTGEKRGEQRAPQVVGHHHRSKRTWVGTIHQGPGAVLDVGHDGLGLTAAHQICNGIQR